MNRALDDFNLKELLLPLWPAHFQDPSDPSETVAFCPWGVRGGLPDPVYYEGIPPDTGFEGEGDLPNPTLHGTPKGVPIHSPAIPIPHHGDRVGLGGLEPKVHPIRPDLGGQLSGRRAAQHGRRLVRRN